MKVARDVIAKKNGSNSPAAKMTDVIVAKHDVMAGAKLTAEDVTIGKMAGEVAPESIFRTPADIEGRVLGVPMFTGQPVMETMLKPKGTGAGLQALVPAGKRAITVEINEFSGVAGFLVTGCKVDVVATLAGEGGDMLSRTIVQNVLVTAIGQRAQNQPGAEGTESVKSVTLIVTPKEAEAIELAAATGRPRLVLRSSGDEKTASTDGVSVAELRGKPKKGASDPFLPVEWTRPAPPVSGNPSTQPQAQDDSNEPIRRTVRVIRGGVESDVTMELPAAAAATPKWMTNNPTDPVLPGQSK
jgi:pilus assembly protein CpaB